jgi:hypothetical protein
VNDGLTSAFPGGAWPVEGKFDKALERGLAAAKSKDAIYLPGWCGPADDD